jgi:hypothetical protein
MSTLRAVALASIILAAACHDGASPGPSITAPSPAASAAKGAGLPRPKLVLDSPTPTEIPTTGGTLLRYEISVSNSSAYPDALFAPSPELEPCGLNSSASRTWVDFYDGDDVRLNGFCALSGAADLNSLWFVVRQGSVPRHVYMVLTDRLTGDVLTSNRVRLP